jgi:hypothetical protein
MGPADFSSESNVPAGGRDENLAFQFLLQGRLDRETDLLMHRTAWVMASQAFLFSAYAVALNGRAGAATPRLASRSDMLIVMIPWLSLVSLMLLYLTIGAGMAALVRLRRHVAPHSAAHVHRFDPGPATRMAGLAAPLLIPLAFLASWLFLLALR